MWRDVLGGTGRIVAPGMRWVGFVMSRIVIMSGWVL